LASPLPKTTPNYQAKSSRRHGDKSVHLYLWTYGNNVEATFDFVERIIRLVAFDNVASALLLVWMGIYDSLANPTMILIYLFTISSVS